MALKLLDLFSGIGGFSLGLERSGAFETVAFCEIEPYCQKVLAKHWPKVPIYDDVRTITAERLAADGIAVDAICGGFPCQDISTAGKGAGLAGERSGLWNEYARIISETLPRYVIVENVAALLARGLDEVLRALAALGYDAEWHCIPASYVGAPHRRDRLWIVANSNSVRKLQQGWGIENERGRTFYSFQETLRTIPIDCGGRDFDGLSNRVDRLRALGNAVVPQIPELIGRSIAKMEAKNG